MEDNFSRRIDHLVEAMNFANEKLEKVGAKIAEAEKTGEENHKEIKDRMIDAELQKRKKQTNKQRRRRKT